MKMLILLVAMAISATTLLGQCGSAVAERLLLEQPYAADAVAIGDLIYVTNRDGLAVVDASDRRFAQIGQTTSGAWAKGIDADGDLAVLAYESAFAVVDITSPTEPIVISETPASVVTDVAISGDTAIVANFVSGLHIYDLSNPTLPVHIGTLRIPGFPREIERQGDRLYVAGDAGGFTIIDISSPRAPVIIGWESTPGTALGVGAGFGIAVIADGSRGLQVIDIADPASPQLIATLPLPSPAVDALPVSQDRILVATEDAVILEIDISDPVNPYIRTSIGAASRSARLLQSDHGPLCIDGALSRLALSTATPPEPLAIVAMGGAVNDVECMGDLALAAVADVGLVSLDVSDPLSPILLDAYYFPNPADITIERNVAIVCDPQRSTYIIDIANPMNLTRLSTLGQFQENGQSATVEGDLLYVATYTGIRIYDISDPADPVRLGQTGGYTTGVDVVGTLAYVTQRAGQFQIYDVADPTFPLRLGELRLPGVSTSWPWDLIVRDGVAYVGTSAVHSFVTIDVRDPWAPRVLGSAGLGSSDLLIHDERAIMTSGTGGVQVIDITDPARLRTLGSFAAGGWTNRAGGVAITKGYALVGLGENLVTFDASCALGCYADCDSASGPGVLDIFDFLCFQDAFIRGDQYACDCDTTSGAGVCDVLDFLCFQDAFTAGCL